MKRLLGVLGLVGWAAAASCGGESTSHDRGGAARAGTSNAGSHGADGGRSGAAPRAGRGGTGGSSGHAGGGTSGDGDSGGATAGSGDTGGSGLVGPGPCSVEPAELDGLSFDVELSPGDDQVFVFHFVDGPDGLEVVIGSDGYATRSLLDVHAGKLELVGNLEIRDDSGFGAWTSDNGKYIENLELCVEPPRDSAGRLRGKGSALVIANADDYEDQWEEPIDFDAGVDTRAPSFPNAMKLYPLEPELIPLSEPVAPGASAMLSEPPASLDPIVMAGTVVGFRAPIVLPLGLDSAVTASAHDLGGLRLASSLRLSTDADPGVQAQDGFESELHSIDYGYPAELVHGSRALEGSASLFLPAGAETVLHLTRPSPSAKLLRLELLPEPFLLQTSANIVVRAGVIGGTKIESFAIPFAADWSLDGSLGAAGAGGGGGAGAGSADAIAVELELGDAGDDVLVSISTPLIEESSSAVVAAVIDRLRIE